VYRYVLLKFIEFSLSFSGLAFKMSYYLIPNFISSSLLIPASAGNQTLVVQLIAHTD
jgi:hypothetical protein